MYATGLEYALEKLAMNALTKRLLAASPQKAESLLAQLPKADRAQASYKVLGNKARQAVQSSMPPGAGHGADHVWDVTRDAQGLMGGRLKGRPTNVAAGDVDFSPDVYRRGVMSSLLHDIGRPAEGRVMKGLQAQLGKKPGKASFKQQPDLWHSELSGRHAKDFLQKNKAVAKNVPGLDKGQLSGAIRGHDTDIHKKLPWTRERLLDDPAAGATYLADKTQGLGAKGVDRTLEMARKFDETPAETYNFAIGKNVPKYQKAIDDFAPSPAARDSLMAKLDEYRTGMEGFAQQRGVPLQKAAMAVSDFTRVYRLFLNNPGQTRSSLRKLIEAASKGNPKAKSEAFAAIYKIPRNQRMRIMEALKGL